MNNKIKSQLQQREFAALKDKTRVILKWATGCGKSKMTIGLINHAVETTYKRRKAPVRVLFVVAERAHINNWQDEFTKWKLRVDRMAIDIICYASLHKYKDKDYDIIVFDEAHHMFTIRRVAQIEELHEGMCGNNYVFLLSATLPSAKVIRAEEIFGNFTTSTVSLKDAIKKDILSNPRVYVIEMQLDNKEANEEIQIGSGDNLPVVGFADRGKYIYNNTPCIIKCTQYEKYLYLTNTMEYWKQRYEHSHNQYHHNRWVLTGSVRKRFMGELKTKYVKQLIQSFPLGKRFVCFCATVTQATKMSNTNTISSKKTIKHNQAIIDAFNAKKIRQIYAVGMITEGMNLTDIEVGIIVQLDGKERLFIQKFGRSMRAEDPVSFIFYFKHTQDEVYLKNALENIENKYVRYVNINDLNTIKL